MLIQAPRSIGVAVVLACTTAMAAEVTHVYFGTTWNGAIRRGAIDGQVLTETLVPSAPYTFAVAVDLAAHRVYWTQPEHVRRADLHGGPIEDIHSAAGRDFRGIALDLPAGFVYWSDAATNTIGRAALDGANPQTLYVAEDPGAQLGHVVLDTPAGLMYWAEGHAIRRASLDGSDVQTVAAGLIEALGVTLDRSAGKVYWTDARELEYGSVHRANLDGSGVEDVTPAVYCFDPEGIEINLSLGKIYYTDRWAYGVNQANRDGTEDDCCLPFGLMGYTRGIALSPDAALLSRYPLFFGCLTGPGGEPCSGDPKAECDCLLFDPDHDSDVDLVDFAVFQRFYSAD